MQEQAPQVATLLEQSSGQAQQGGDTTQRRAYLGTLSKSIERAKVNPRSRQAGTVMVRFTVGPDGNDNGGNIDRTNATAPGTDLGYQLWDVKHRRQPAKPPPQSWDDDAHQKAWPRLM